MVEYEDALKIAKDCWSEVDYVVDQSDAFVFSKKDDCSLGGSGPVAVIKSSGECLNYLAFLDGDYDSAILNEGYIADYSPR